MKTDSSPAQPSPTASSVSTTLLAELDAFKNSESFAEFGFGRGGPRDWLTRVQTARRHDAAYSLEERISLGELETLGQEYRRTGGLETEDTRWFRRRVLDPTGND